MIMLVWIVAPATKQSGQGGRSEFTTEANLTAPSQYDLIPAGEPSVCENRSFRKFTSLTVCF
jgi:hypothetical protein